jgi:acyl-CoA reductase-like NAD-dependent aldehyde dehydrogenase
MHGAQQNYIGGTWVPAVAAAPNVNPSNLNDVIADYARAQPAEVDAAVAAATAAFAAYSCSTPQERFEALKRISDEILARTRARFRKRSGDAGTRPQHGDATDLSNNRARLWSRSQWFSLMNLCSRRPTCRRRHII